jgi:hypothetical protein
LVLCGNRAWIFAITAQMSSLDSVSLNAGIAVPNCAPLRRRVHAMTGAGGSAVWRPGGAQLIEARGDAWRYLWWRLPGVRGIDALLPLEAAGDHCRA